MEVSASRGWGACWAAEEEDRLGAVKEAWSEMTVAAHSSGGLEGPPVADPRSRGRGLWVSGVSGRGASGVEWL